MHICATGFRGLRSSLITLRFFVHLLRLIAKNVANVFNVTSGIRVSVVTCHAKDVRRRVPGGSRDFSVVLRDFEGRAHPKIFETRTSPQFSWDFEGRDPPKN